MDEIENPGADEAHGASDSVLADASDNTVNGETGQDREPRSRHELICRNTFVNMYGVDCDETPTDKWSIDAYDIVPDRARTDPAIGPVEMREGLFLALVNIAESLIGGPPFHDYKRTIALRYESLLVNFSPDGWGNRINLELVKELIQETVLNGGSNGRR
jgi:hypothetical protein